MKERLDTCLKKSVAGLKALKQTYATCCQTTARVDVIINKIQTSASDDVINETIINPGDDDYTNKN